MTRTAFVIGHPISHSRSPLIHGYWLAAHGIKGDYQPFDILPEELGGFFERVRDGTYVGGNVTVPHKHAALSFCDDIDPVALKIGAINTLIVGDGTLFGTNTDWLGFLANLDDRAPNWDDNPGPALVIGAGGGARAVILGLNKRGFAPIRIFDKYKELAEALADELGRALEADLFGYDVGNFSDFAKEAHLVVNASTVGMNGTRFENLPLALLPETTIVADIVYTPLVTPLLADAAARGLKTVDGLGMLLHQAVPGFQAWFGLRPEVTKELRELIERDMGLK
jgi:shikimate dehydrogenase